MPDLTARQLAVAHAKPDTTTFLEGPAGSGKTSVGVERLKYLLAAGIPAESILVMLPQRTLAFPYLDYLRQPDLAAGGQAAVLTLGGLSRRAVELFWPLAAAAAGFKNPQRPPTFLSLETAQYFMARIVGPVIEREGYFDTIAIERSRLYSQLIDNLNKAAVVGFPYREVGERLKAAWNGEDTQRRIYDDMQTCVELFRAYCLEHNLLDFSLQVELFLNHLWPLKQCYHYLTGQHRHLIADNIEEDSPAAHRVIGEWLPECDSALLIYDSESGYRRFLGADAQDAYTLRDACGKHVTFEKSYVTSRDLNAFGRHLAASLRRISTGEIKGDVRRALRYDDHRYHTQMVDWVGDEIRRLVHDEGVQPGEIVVLAPILSDALRFSLMNRLQGHAVPARSHRPSRALREEPAALCLLALAQIAHPHWRLRPTLFDAVYTLMAAIEGLDLVRAQLLGRGVFHIVDGQPALRPFDSLQSDLQQRITFALGNRYERLRTWLADYAAGEPTELDHFLSRLFGEVLSQEGFGFHSDFDRAAVTANLIDSARKFRWIITESQSPAPEGKTLAQEYVEMVAQGIIADQYLRRWDLQHENAVLVAPAYTFLLSNRPVDYQFWLNVGSQGWAERLYQPLTNPYVLSLQWQEGRKWTDSDEVLVGQDALYRLTLGLIRRCRKHVYLGFSELSEQGYEQRGALLDAIQRMLRRLSA